MVWEDSLTQQHGIRYRYRTRAIGAHYPRIFPKRRSTQQTPCNGSHNQITHLDSLYQQSVPLPDTIRSFPYVA